jgi:hypothetical protein
MHALGDGVEAERIGEARLLHELLEARRHVVAARELRPEHQTELHRQPTRSGSQPQGCGPHSGSKTRPRFTVSTGTTVLSIFIESRKVS